MINEALSHYHFYNPSIELIRHNENMTYKVTDGEELYVLRIHMPIEGFNLEMLSSTKNKVDLITNEMKLLNYLAESGHMRTQRVKFNTCGKPVTILENNIPVTVLEWVEGSTLENMDITFEIANKIGIMIGRLHNEFEQNKNKLINRYYYDSLLLSRMIDEASRASIQGHFNNQHAETIIETLSNIKNYLSSSRSKFIPVHADLGKSNLIYNYHNKMIIPIDFSLFGYCISEMDLASVFSHINNEALNQEILRGYKSIHNFEPDNLGIEVCYCLQILLFIIGQHNRFAGETWFQDRLTVWCENHFIPLNTYNIK